MGPVTASMRRTPAATPLSLTILKSAICPVFRACVPPQSSFDTPGTFTTRTTSPYFSPKSAIAPLATAALYGFSSVTHVDVVPDRAIHAQFDLGLLGGLHRSVMREVESQTIGLHERALLVHVLAEHLAQRGVQEMRGGVIALGVPPHVGGHARVHRTERERAAQRPAVTVRPSILRTSSTSTRHPCPTISPLSEICPPDTA